MKCPKCGQRLSEKEILQLIQEALPRLGEKEILRAAGVIRGRRGTGAAKSRSTEAMRKAGRLGGLAKAANRAKAEKAAKAKPRTKAKGKAEKK